MFRKLFFALPLLLFACAESSPPSSSDDDSGVDRDLSTVPDATDSGTDSAPDLDADTADADTTIEPDAEPDADPCPAGENGCPCDAGECDDGLECIGGLCSELECPPGTEGCVCADAEFCEVDLICEDENCVSCPFGTLDCPCDEDACEDGASCDAESGLCRAPASCSELGCAPLQLCEVETERCLPACELGFQWNDSRNLCVPDSGSSCDPGVEGSLLEECRRDGRECVLVAGSARCGECLTGFFELDGTCTPATCGDPATDPFSQVDECAELGRLCDETPDGADCGACVEGYVEDAEGPGCIPPRLCEDVDCGSLNRACDPADGYARCSECLEGFVPEPGEVGCIPYVECGELDCSPFSRLCEFDVTAYCGACLDGWTENADGLCECEATGGVPRQYWRDSDGDGFGDPGALGVCEPTEGYVDNDLDCDDSLDSIAPGEPDLPDADAIDSNCDGTDGDISRLIFVVPGAPDAGADGSPEAPYGSLDAGTVAADWAGDGVDAVALASGVHEGPLVVIEGVDVYGGYDAEDSWARSLDRASVVRTAADSERLSGLIATDVAEPTEVTGIAFEADAGASSGQSSYGGAVIRSAGLTLRNVSFTAGRGGNGTNGEDGEAGANGSGGAGGQSGGDGGNGGAAGVNTSCASSNGGTGGRGGARNTYGDSGTPDSCGGAGGEDGRPWDNEGRPGAAGCDRAVAGPAGAPGSDAGEAGTLVGDWWRPSDGTRGDDGLGGLGGGGGGGGGGPEILNYRGGGGGGGGAGGCGGNAGDGGDAGGASIGLWIVDSTGLTGIDLEVVANDGGSAGAGGAGGDGGSGASGGGGGPGQGVALSGSGDGGRGGSGANGGPGGAGGDGAGGSSVGVFCVRTSWGPSGESSVIVGSAGADAGAAAGLEAIVLDCD